MPFPILAAMGIAKLVAPRLGRLFGGDKGEEIANKVTGIAMGMAGQQDPQALLNQLQGNPEMLAEMQSKMAEHEATILAEETERLVAVNRTMQAEVASSDPYVRRWRPTYGYLTAFAWFIMMVGTTATFLWAAIKTPEQAPVIIAAVGTAMSQSSMLWGIALAVLGVSVHSRSKDKQVANGQTPGSAFATIAGLFKKRT